MIRIASFSIVLLLNAFSADAVLQCRPRVNNTANAASSTTLQSTTLVSSTLSLSSTSCLSSAPYGVVKDPTSSVALPSTISSNVSTSSSAPIPSSSPLNYTMPSAPAPCRQVVIQNVSTNIFTAYGPFTNGTGYLQVNQDLPGTTTSLRSSLLKSQIQTQFNNLIQSNPLYTTDSNWNEDGYWGPKITGVYRSSTENFFNIVNNVTMAGYGGPGLWCGKGQGNSIPANVPLPYSGSGAYTSNTTCSADFESRFETFRVDLGIEANWDGIDVNECNGIDGGSVKFPIKIQPNGGIQIAWKELSADKIHITYLDPNFQRVCDDLIVEGRSLGGLVAFDDGDCDAPSTADANSGMFKGLVVYWKGGKLVWAKRLTDPYRSNPQTAEYIEDVNGNGDFTYDLGGGSLVYDRTTQLFAAYFQVSGGRGGHWGSNMYYLDMSGNVPYQTFGCSHDIGGKVIPDASGSFPFICSDDGFGFERPENKAFGPRAAIQQTNTVSQAGWSAGKTGSLVKRNGKEAGYILAAMTKYQQFYYQIQFIIFDTQMKKVVVVDYPLNDVSIDFVGVHLVPYGDGSKGESYMLYYTKTNMTSIKCCSTSKEARCFGSIESKNYEIVSFVGGKFQSISGPFQHDMRITYDNEPDIYPNGDLLWGTFDNTAYPFNHQTFTSMNVTRMKNCN